MHAVFRRVIVMTETHIEPLDASSISPQWVGINGDLRNRKFSSQISFLVARNFHIALSNTSFMSSQHLINPRNVFPLSTFVSAFQTFRKVKLNKNIFHQTTFSKSHRNISWNFPAFLPHRKHDPDTIRCMLWWKGTNYRGCYRWSGKRGGRRLVRTFIIFAQGKSQSQSQIFFLSSSANM